MSDKKMFKPPCLVLTSTFYDDLSKGKAKRGLWGKDKRFDPHSVSEKTSVNRYFKNVVAGHLNGDEKVLDLGCGPGSFLVSAASLCREIIGADISESFVEAANEAIEQKKIGNANAVLVEGAELPFSDNCFDAVLMTDVIHHLDDIESTLHQVRRVLKPGGKLLIFEPNKKNPLLYLMCLLDRNEWGLLSLGTKNAYHKILTPDFHIFESEYNGLLIGPDSRLSLWAADLISAPSLRKFIGFLSPKIFIAAKNGQDS